MRSDRGSDRSRSPAERAKDLCLTALGLNCLRLLLQDVFGLEGPLWLVIGIAVGGGFWVALVAWSWLTYRERKTAAGSTGALVRPWVMPLLLVAGVAAGGLFVASLAA